MRSGIKKRDVNIKNCSEDREDMFKCAELLTYISDTNISSAFESQALLAEYFFDEKADERLLNLLRKKI